MGVLRGALFLIGTSIGAGFLSGAELVRFFHTDLFLLPVLCSSLVFFGVCVLFLRLGKRYGGYRNAMAAIFGKAGKAMQTALSLCAFIPCAGMLAGLDALLPDFSPLLSVAGLAAVTLCLKKGMKGIGYLNSVLVPLLLFFIFYYGRGELDFFYPVAVAGGSGWAGGIVYAFMNVFLAAPVLMDAGKEMRRIVPTAGLAAFVICAGAICILGRVYREGAGAINAEMPFLYVMRGRKIFFVAAALAILTSLASSLYPLLHLTETTALCRPENRRKKYAAKGGILLAAFVLSRFGLSGIVRYLYPALGVAGMVLSAVCILYEYFFKKHHEKIHSGGKQT